MEFMRRRPHRLSREHYRGRVTVAFTVCIEGRDTPFRDADTVRHFTEKLAVAAVSNDCHALIYCFMPEHLHVILNGKTDTADTWKAMTAFKQATGYWFGRNQPEFAWQEGFYDHVIGADEDLGAQLRNVADNPIRKGLVPHWKDYPFTGAIGIDVDTVLSNAAMM